MPGLADKEHSVVSRVRDTAVRIAQEAYPSTCALGKRTL